MNSGPTIITPALWTSGGNPHQPLSTDERALLAAIATVVRFRKGERIYQEGDRANAVFNIIAGVVKLYQTLPDGKQYIAGFFFSHDLFGLAENGTYVNSAEAVTAVNLYRLLTTPLEARLRSYPHLDFSVISKLCHDLREAQHHAFLLSRQRAVAKVGLFLQMLEAHQTAAGESSSEVYLPMSRSDIAAYAGISPEAVSRSLRELVQRGVLGFRDRRHVRIIDRQRLEVAISEVRPRTENGSSSRAGD